MGSGYAAAAGNADGFLRCLIAEQYSFQRADVTSELVEVLAATVVVLAFAYAADFVLGIEIAVIVD